MLNEQAVMEYARQATDNAIDIMKYLQLLILPDVELQSIQQEYYSLPEDTDEEVAYKDKHLGSRVIYDDSIYKVVFNLNNITLDKKEQLALPAYYSMLNSVGRGIYSSSSTTTNSTTTNIDTDLIFRSGDSIVLNNYNIDDVSSVDLQNIKALNFKRIRESGESNLDDIYTLAFNPIGSKTTNNNIVLKDMFTNTSDYFNSYFRDYFYSYFDENYQMEMTFEQIIPNFTKGALFNRQYYAYASGGHFYLSAFHNSKILGYGSKMFMAGDNFVFKHGAEGSINDEKMGKYFSLQYSTGVEGVNNSNPFANIHLAGYYGAIVAGEICRDINGTTSSINQLDRDLLFLGDYKKEVDVQVENKLFFGNLANWQIIDGVRREPAYIQYDDRLSNFNLKSPTNDFNLGYGTSFDGITNLNIKYIEGANESVELTAISKNGKNLPIVIKNVNSGSYNYTDTIYEMQSELTSLNKRVIALDQRVVVLETVTPEVEPAPEEDTFQYYPSLFISDIYGSPVNRSEDPFSQQYLTRYKFLPRDVNITADPALRNTDMIYYLKIADEDIDDVVNSFEFTLNINAVTTFGKEVIVRYLSKTGESTIIYESFNLGVYDDASASWRTTETSTELDSTKFRYDVNADAIYKV